MVIAYGCCGGSREKVWANLHHLLEREFTLLYEQPSIAVAYNTIIDLTLRRYPDVEALVLLHDDLQLTDEQFEDKVRAALADPDVAVLGVAGARGVRSLDWWNYQTIGHQLTDTTALDFGVRSGEVDGLEGSLLVLSRWALENLRFDETYDGFHGYDCDVARQALDVGKKVLVIDVDTHHRTTLGWKSPEVHQSWLRAAEIYRKKWSL